MTQGNGITLNEDFISYFGERLRKRRLHDYALTAFYYLIEIRVNELTCYTDAQSFHKAFRVSPCFEDYRVSAVAWNLLHLCIDDFAEIVEDWRKGNDF